MLRFVCLALFVTVVVGLEFKADIGSQWQKFKAAHGKTYSANEESKRKMVFRRNVETILQHNLRHDLGEETYTQGINEFSDMPHEEFVKTMCGVKGPRPENRTFTDVPTERAAPASIDWRLKNAVTEVKNQGTCGSCWAFSAAGAIEGAWAVSKGELVSLSEQQILDCASNSKYGNDGCEGGFPHTAINYVIQNGGIDKGDCYKYKNVQGTCAYSSSCKAATVSKYVEVKAGDENALRDVAAGKPISVCVDAGQSSFQNYRTGIYNPSYCSQDTNHAVTLVGYGTDSGKDFWLIKNSWGTSWGDKGYFKLARNANNKCGITNDIVYAVV